MSAPRPQKLEHIEALRGLAALAVLWFHLTNGNPAFLPDGLLKASGEWGWVGVQAFFVISGFVIPHALLAGGYRPEKHLWAFVCKRAWRLWPAFAVAVGLSAFLEFLSYQSPLFAGAREEMPFTLIAANLAYVCDFVGARWLNPVFWSLAIEVQFYLLLAVTAPALLHRSDTAPVLAVAAMLALGAMPVSKIYLLPHLPVFALGLAAFYYRNGRVAARGAAGLVATAAVVTGWRMDIESAFFGAATAFVLCAWKGGVPGILLWLGSISYSVYLLHVPLGGRVINLSLRAGDDAVVKVVALVSAVFLAILAAALLHRYVERPTQAIAAKIRYL